MGVVAFWIALAAVLIAGGWAKTRSEALKHETLRKLIERNGAVDEAQVRALFCPPPPPLPAGVAPWWALPRPPGDGYTILRVFGTIAMCVAAGLLLFFTPVWLVLGEEDAMVGVAIGVITLAFGVGFFVASRFTEPPARVKADQRRAVE